MDEDFLMVLAPAHAREIIKDWPLSHFILCLHIDGEQELHVVDVHDFDYAIGEIDPGVPTLPKLPGRPLARLEASRLLSCLDTVVREQNRLLQQVSEHPAELRQEYLIDWLLDNGYRSHQAGGSRVFTRDGNKIELCLDDCADDCLKAAIERCCRIEGVSLEVFHRMVERHRNDKAVLDDGF